MRRKVNESRLIIKTALSIIIPIIVALGVICGLAKIYPLQIFLIIVSVTVSIGIGSTIYLWSEIRKVK